MAWTAEQNDFFAAVMEELFPGWEDTLANEPFGPVGDFRHFVEPCWFDVMTKDTLGGGLANEWHFFGDGWSMFFKIVRQDSGLGTTDTHPVSGLNIHDQDRANKQFSILRLVGFELWPTQ